PELNGILVSRGTSPVQTGVRLADLLRRPELDYEALAPVDAERPNLPAPVFEAVEIKLKYEGYIRRQQADIAEMRRLEERTLPQGMDYANITGLRMEAREKLQKVRPANRPGFSHQRRQSADISVLLYGLPKWKRAGRGQ
ncbi:MAG: tRNA uridine-5-carboxymethylaminomethyl(34) synthesis enzyme MnmG, partial [[Clostridium] leptum]